MATIIQVRLGCKMISAPVLVSKNIRDIISYKKNYISIEYDIDIKNESVWQKLFRKMP